MTLSFFYSDRQDKCPDGRAAQCWSVGTSELVFMFGDFMLVWISPQELVWQAFDRQIDMAWQNRQISSSNLTILFGRERASLRIVGRLSRRMILGPVVGSCRTIAKKRRNIHTKHPRPIARHNAKAFAEAFPNFFPFRERLLREPQDENNSSSWCCWRSAHVWRMEGIFSA